MDPLLKQYLQKHHINYEKYDHPPVFTVEQSKKIKLNIPGIHTKNLFLKDENSAFYLICMPAEKRLNILSIRKKFNLKKLQFASPLELKSQLNLTPGSVSPFGMIYSTSVYLIIDKKIWLAEKTGFHPNINTSTIVLTHDNLKKFYNSLKVKKEVLEL
ncbi:MAG: prolyl-tRNA synthetase associated domain-containing protein [Nanoarchaeota archaeon]|nr:prolyl-tRNA synthetase associated domain-containing protein [Nanoarchaeota archaeon]